MAENPTIDNGSGTDYEVSAEQLSDDSYLQSVELHTEATGTKTKVSNSNPLPISDAGGSLTVDGTLAVTQSGTWDEVGINDSGNSITVDDGGSSLTVDGTVGVSGTVTVDSELTTADLDTGAGTDTRAVIGLVGSKSGGGALIPGDATAGLKVDLGADNDVTVTGSVTANAGTNLNTSTLALETGGNLATAVASLSVIDDWDETDRAKVNPIVGQAGVQGGSGSVSNTTQRVVLATDVALPAGTNAIGKLAANSGVDIGDVDVTSLPASTNTIEVVGDVAQDIGVAGNPVLIGARSSYAEPTAMSTDGDAVYPWSDRRGRLIVTPKAGTATTTQVADTNSSTQLLAADTARLGASVQNTSSAVLYVKCGTTASSTDFSARLVQYAYYEVPFGYTGRIDGIWATDPGDGSAVITAFT